MPGFLAREIRILVVHNVSNADDAYFHNSTAFTWTFVTPRTTWESNDDVSFYNSTASTWTFVTPRTTWESNAASNAV